MFAVLIALILLVAVSPTLGQDTAGKVVGVVMDPQGAVVPKAMVSVKNVATGITNTAITDAGGQYQVLNLAIGNYSVTVEKEGFRKTVTKAYPLEINQSVRVDVTLTVGAASQTVEVNAAATQVETYNSTLGASVTSRELVDMPLNGRDILDLARLEPGVTDQNEENGAAGSFSIGGGRTDSVTYLLDGGLNNDLLDNSVVFDPNPDTVAEFRILESNYTAEYGRNGGGIISIVTKSGANDYHGTAFDFARNGAFDANRFFNKREIDPVTNQVVPRDTLKRHQFGATLGGPVGIPGVWLAKNKAFFFVGYQGQRKIETERPSPDVIDTFTPAEITGDFSQSANAGTVAAFLGANPYFQADPAKAAQGIIDPNSIDQASKKVIAAGLIPVSATGVLTPSAPAKDNRVELTGKVDYNFSQSDRLSVTLGWNKLTQTDPFAGGATVPFPIEYLDKYEFLNVAYTKNFSTRLLNEFRVTAQRSNILQDKPSSSFPVRPHWGSAPFPIRRPGRPF
jgi:hypothetical protein